MILDLKGKWLFKSADENEFSDAIVPGCNFTDLLRLGKIADPNISVNERDVQWVADKDWIYKRQFEVSSALLDCDKVYLVADKLDTLCDVDINGERAFSGENYHIRYREDIKKHLKEGENEITVTFHSPTAFVNLAYAACKTPQNTNGLTGIVHIRKPQCHFGWDWGPVLPQSGITGDVYLEGIKFAELNDLKIEQMHHYDGSVTLEMTCSAESYCEKSLSALFSVKAPSGEEFNVDGVDIGNGFQAVVEIKKPELWWTRELSGKDEQPLYEVVCALLADGDVICGKVLKIGLRTLRLNRDKDEFGRNFCFELNGVKVFSKGANYIPPDTFTSRYDGYDALFSAVTFSNMNTLRVWGGGEYPDDVFYDYCDRLGILVWQDFMFACQAYPFFVPHFLENVEKEVDCAVKRLRHHASLALWCGNNEVEQLTPSWLWMRPYVEWTEKFFYDVLPKRLASLDNRDYTEGSPAGLDFLYGTFADNVGDTHMWEVWHGLQPVKYYRKRFPRFCSEFGFESLPDEKTLDYFTSDPSLRSADMLAHQKCSGGNGKLLYYALNRFAPFKENVYVTQLCQADAVKEAVTHFRRNKGRCNGSLFWQLNDCWPTSSWSAMDSFNRYKALTYKARRFYQPVSVSIEDSDGGFYIYTLNDTNNDYSAQLTFKVCEYDGKVLIEKVLDVSVTAGESQRQLGVGMAAIRIQNKRLRAYAYASLTVDGVEIARDTVLLRREKYAKLPPAEIKLSFDFPSDGVLAVTLSADKYARNVRLTNALSDAPFSDNWFDLLPDEKITVTQNIGKTCPIDILEKNVTAFSSADLTKDGNAFTSFFIRLAVLLKPINFLSKLFTRRVPKNIKNSHVSSYGREKNE